MFHLAAPTGPAAPRDAPVAVARAPEAPEAPDGLLPEGKQGAWTAGDIYIYIHKIRIWVCLKMGYTPNEIAI